MSLEMIRLMGLKFWLGMKWHNFTDVMLWGIHCRKGFHKPLPHHIIVTEHKLGKRKKKINETKYYSCAYCKTLFFPSEKDYEQYMEIEERNSKYYLSAIKSAMKSSKRRKV